MTQNSNAPKKKNICQMITFKMGFMLTIVFIYFLVELIVGQILKSVTLVADSFHMLSDFVAIAIGIISRRISKWPKSSRNTFGWQRAEVVGTLTNTVILTTLTFTILIKAIQRFIEIEEIKNPKLLLIVGAVGLAVNIIGLIVLRHSHGHSHGMDKEIQIETPPDEVNIEEGGDVPLHQDHNDVGHGHNDVGHSHKEKIESAASMNLKAVHLHVLSDFMGSLAVCASALIIWLVPGKGEWKNYIDPLLSLIFVALILFNSIPLLKKSALILLQSVPKQVSIKELKEKMEQIDGIDRVHDLHVWLLQSDVIIGTVHIKCKKEDYVETSKKVKDLFHENKIHCTTIQAEFEEHGCECVETNTDNNGNNEPIDIDHCELACNTQSKSTSCCPTRQNSHLVPSLNTTKIIVTGASDSTPFVTMISSQAQQHQQQQQQSDDNTPPPPSTTTVHVLDDDATVFSSIQSENNEQQIPLVSLSSKNNQNV